jgi:hypothetical protein
MENQSFHKNHLEFDGLLEQLRANGFRIGIDSHLRLHKVLNKVSGNCSPEDLRTLLAPIFATNKKQQESFYSAFDSYFGLVEAVDVETTIKVRPKANSKADKDPIWTHRWPYLLIGVLTTILIGTFLYRHKQQTQIGIQQSIQTTVTLQTQTSVNNEPVPELIYAIRGVALLAPMIFLGLFEFYFLNRRSLMLRRLRSNYQPHVFSLYPPVSVPALFDSSQFHNSTRQLRGRQEIEFTQLDLGATIHATIKSLGYPQFRYRRTSKIPEYLLLIERTTYDDHVAAFFDELANSLEEDGVFVTRYYFNGDPRICFRRTSSEGSASRVRNSKKKDSGEEGIPLSLVLSEHEESRLLMLGACEGLFDPLLGTLQDWTNVFTNWKERAVITSIPAVQWTSRERILAQQFFVAPATLDGLHSFAEYCARTNIADAPRWVTNETVRMPQDFDAFDSVALKAYLGAEAFQWLCACAVYPRLEWVLTIYLGSVTKALGIVDDVQLLKLISLPWFRSGSIPQELREELISNLNPKLYKKVQKAIINIFEQLEELNRLKREAFRPLRIAVPRAHKIFRRELLKKVLGITPRARVIRDYVFVRFLQSKPKALLDFLLPFALIKLFYPSGNTALRSRIGARILLAVFIAAVIWLAAPALARTIKTEPALTIASLQNPLPSSPSRVSSPLASSTIRTSPLPSLSPLSLITPNTTEPSPDSLLTPTPSILITSTPNVSTSPIVIPTQELTPAPTMTPSATPAVICPEVKVVCSVYPQVQNKMSAVIYSATATTNGGKQLQESRYLWSLMYNGSLAAPTQGRVVSGQGTSRVELEWTIPAHTSPALTAKVLVTGFNAACFTESACTVPVQNNQQGSCDCGSCGGMICCPNPGYCISCGSCGFVCCSRDPEQ